MGTMRFHDWRFLRAPALLLAALWRVGRVGPAGAEAGPAGGGPQPVRRRRLAWCQRPGVHRDWPPSRRFRSVQSARCSGKWYNTPSGPAAQRPRGPAAQRPGGPAACRRARRERTSRVVIHRQAQHEPAPGSSVSSRSSRSRCSMPHRFRRTLMSSGTPRCAWIGTQGGSITVARPAVRRSYAPQGSRAPLSRTKASRIRSRGLQALNLCVQAIKFES